MTLLTIIQSLEAVLFNVIANLMISEKLATPGFWKIIIFWNKGYDVILTSSAKFHHVNQIIL